MRNIKTYLVDFWKSNETPILERLFNPKGNCLIFKGVVLSLKNLRAIFFCRNLNSWHLKKSEFHYGDFWPFFDT